MNAITTKGNTMTTIGFEADWTIHRDGCKDATDLEIIGTFSTIDEVANHLIATGSGYADDLTAEQLRGCIKDDSKPCTGLK
tara:strand:- start:1178 stop:1420 length:243 start_codon:yes stop_codon:yes gene_type:complete